MNIPQMPSITDLPIQELRNADVAFKVLEVNLGDIYEPNRDGKMEEKTVEAGKPATRSSEVFDRDNGKDSNQSVKAPPNKKTMQNVIHDSDDDNDDDGEDRSKINSRKRTSEADPNTAKTKKKKTTKQTNAAMSEKRNHLRKRCLMGTSH